MTCACGATVVLRDRCRRCYDRDRRSGVITVTPRSARIGEDGLSSRYRARKQREWAAANSDRNRAQKKAWRDAHRALEHARNRRNSKLRKGWVVSLRGENLYLKNLPGPARDLGLTIIEARKTIKEARR